MRRLGILVCLLGAACSGKDVDSGGCGGAADCQAGFVCVNDACVEICNSDSDCGTPGTICEGDLCIEGARTDAPVITGIDGDGVADTDPTHTDHRIATTLTIVGEHFDGADAQLHDGTNRWPLEICSAESTRLEVLLPEGLTSGSYTLTVVTQAGSCAAPLPVLQGEQGPTGAAGAPGATGATGPAGPQGEAGGGLMLNLELEEDGGTAPVDSSPYAHTVTVDTSGLAQGSIGHSGQAIAFSGGVVSVAGPNRLADTPQVWVEAWVQPQQPMDTTRTIATQEGAYALKQVDAGLSFEVTGTGSGSPCSVATDGAPLEAGVWTHVGGWYDGLRVAVTVRGAVYASQACRVGLVVPSSGDFFLGGADASASEPYLGTIDEVRVRHTAPSSTVADIIATGMVVAGTNQYAAQAVPEAHQCTGLGCELEWIQYDQSGRPYYNEQFYVHYNPSDETMTLHYVRGGPPWHQFNVADNGGTWWWWWTNAAGIGECYPMTTTGTCNGRDVLTIVSYNQYPSRWALRRRAF